MQTGITIADGAITGTLKYLDSGAIATDWGAGNFMVLKFTPPEDATSVKVGMRPSVSSGLVELIGDPDMNGVFKVTDKDEQVFVVRTTVGGAINEETYDLSGLTCNAS